MWFAQESTFSDYAQILIFLQYSKPGTLNTLARVDPHASYPFDGLGPQAAIELQPCWGTKGAHN